MQIIIKQIETELGASEVSYLFKDEKNIIFLDSAMKHEKLGRYSFIGLNPFIVLKGNADKCYLNDEEIFCNVYAKIDELLNKFKVDTDNINSEDPDVIKDPEILEIPFIGGCIGYFAYDAGLRLENIQKEEYFDLDIPEYYFNFYDNVIIFDNRSGKKYISSCGILKSSNDSISFLEEKIRLYMKVEDKYPSDTSNTVNAADACDPSNPSNTGNTGDINIINHENKISHINDINDIKDNDMVFTSNFSKEEYMKTVSRVKEFIKDGDVYIVNLTQRFVAETKKDSYEIYHDLRRINPASFSAYMKLDGFDVISSSPERFLKIRDRLVETRPIKGTRARGKNVLDDLNNRNELINSEKDKAELLMIVDLERNDLSKVCKPFSVNATGLYDLEEYSTVFHLVATVTGELKSDVSPVQCFKACFPGGSITGAPKNSAMQIIKELEGINRSLYTGCIGYFSFNGNADFNIVIRTIIKKDDKVYFGVGGGITWDSDEEAEYQETLDKAEALMRVI